METFEVRGSAVYALRSTFFKPRTTNHEPRTTNDRITL